MLYFITLMFITFTIMSFIGAVGEKDTKARKYMTICFAISTLALVTLKVIGGML